LIRWRLYYDDGSMYSDADGPWENAPADGVVALVVRDPTGVWGRWVYSGYAPITECPRCGRAPGNEYYVKVPDSDEPYATWDLEPFLNKVEPSLAIHDARRSGLVKYGRQVSQAEWQEIMSRASDDPDFPKGTPRRRSTDFR
jgi:hypothetical protein